jgi:hypothetical protein
VFSFSNVVDFFADEFSRLRRWRLAFALVLSRAPDRFLLGHCGLPLSADPAAIDHAA